MHELGSITPTLEEFRQYAATRRVIPVRTTVLADSLTPVGLYRALVTREGEPRPGTFLLESAAEGGVWSRYSFVGAGSVATLTSRDGQAHWIGDAPAGAPVDGDPLDALAHRLRGRLQPAGRLASDLLLEGAVARGDQLIVRLVSAERQRVGTRAAVDTVEVVIR